MGQGIHVHTTGNLILDVIRFVRMFFFEKNRLRFWNTRPQGLDNEIVRLNIKRLLSRMAKFQCLCPWTGNVAIIFGTCSSVLYAETFPYLYLIFSAVQYEHDINVILSGTRCG
jgi:hypothetical protein